MKNIIEKLSEELGLPKRTIENTYRAYWKHMRILISELPLMDDLTDEEFSKLRPNFHIPYIGKLAVTKEHYRKVKNIHKKIERDAEYKENQANG